ncbi:hypothetical protein LCGC14_2132350 [marine sediment metagenome]|uniref:Gamma-glutamyltransferase n=1 Tax=marine sediment metagenome TaxID=412755 RepID=A0A0F9E0Y9_9ZZZZ
MNSYNPLRFAALILFIFTGCKTLPPTPTGLVAEKAMVVSAREEASKIGVEILKKGGNAFDAMIAIAHSMSTKHASCSKSRTITHTDRCWT